MTRAAKDAEARRDMLGAIRARLAESATFDAPRRGHDAAPEPARAVAAHTAAAEPAHARFRAALEAVGGTVSLVSGIAAASVAVGEVLARAGARRVATSDSSLVGRVCAGVELDGVTFEASLDAGALFDVDAGVTGAQWGIAETGTLVLESDRERHRLASLVPPVHIALLEVRHLRDTMAEVLAEVSRLGPEAMSRAITFVTGPSRTSDIELTLAIGVHGPGALHVVLVEETGDG